MNKFFKLCLGSWYCLMTGMLQAISMSTFNNISKTLHGGNLVSCDPTTTQVSFIHTKNFDQLPVGLALLHPATLERFDSIMNKLAVVSHANFEWDGELAPFLPAATAGHLNNGVAVSRPMASIDAIYTFRPSDYQPWRPHLGISLPLFRIHERRVGTSRADEFCYAATSPFPISTLSNVAAKSFEGTSQWDTATLVEADPIECFMGIQLTHRDTASVSLCLPRIQMYQGKTLDDNATMSTTIQAGIGGAVNGRLLLNQWPNETSLSLYFSLEHRLCPRHVLTHKVETEPATSSKTRKKTISFESTIISRRVTEGVALLHLTTGSLFSTSTIFSTIGFTSALYTTKGSNLFTAEQTIIFDIGTITNHNNLIAAFGTELYFMPPQPVLTPLKSLSFRIGVLF